MALKRCTTYLTPPSSTAGRPCQTRSSTRCVDATFAQLLSPNLEPQSRVQVEHAVCEFRIFPNPDPPRTAGRLHQTRSSTRCARTLSTRRRSCASHPRSRRESAPRSTSRSPLALYTPHPISICLSFYLSIYPYICLRIYLSIYLFVYLFCLSIYLSIHLSIYLFLHLSIPLCTYRELVGDRVRVTRDPDPRARQDRPLARRGQCQPQPLNPTP